MTDQDDELICGENFDHELILIGEGGGMRTYECENCGAELWEEDDD